MSRPLSLSLILLLLALGVGSWSASAQDTAVPTDPAVDESAEEALEDLLDGFGETIQVNVVNVLVHVTDKQGRPITDLTVDDFEIRENRRPVEITNFRAVNDGRRREVPGTAEAVEVDPDAPPAPFVPSDQLPPVPEEDRLRLVILVDNFNIRPLERKRNVSRLQHFIFTLLGPDDQVMVATFDRSLHIRHPFTTDRRLIATALDDLHNYQGEGGRYDAERRRMVEELQETEDPELALNFLLPYADQVFHDLNTSIDGIEDMIRDLGGLPGRKAILYLSSGLPMVAAGDLFQAVDYQFPSSSAQRQMFSYDASRRFDHLGDLANANDVVFYTVDVGGLRPNQSGTAEHSGLDEARISLNIENDRQANLQQPLHFMAQVTGGRAIINQNEIVPALEHVASDFHSYYSLGFEPSHFGDGQYYKIKVKVNRRGVKVRHRKGYRDKSPSVRMEEGTFASLLHGFEENPLAVDVVFGHGEKRQNDQFVVPLQVRIPVANIVLLPKGNSSVARLRLYIAVMDSEGRLSPVKERPLGIRIANDQVEAARGEYWLYPHQLLMRAGPQRVAVGVRDELGGDTSFFIRTLTVP